MLRSIWIAIRRFLVTSFIADIICLIWQQAEIQMYGCVQYRAVDDLIMFIMIPIIYMAVAKFDKD